jgi:hypothetical protein
MPVTLNIEDGSGIANANAYGEDAGDVAADILAACRAFALNRGVVLSADDPTLSTQLINATDYLETFNYVGSPVSYTQSLSWPRNNVQFDPDNPFPANAIPIQLVYAQYQLCIEQFNGINLMVTVDHSQGGFVIEDKTDVLMTKFSERIGTTVQPTMPKVAAYLRSLVIPSIALRTLRV